jgi:AAA+ superfamily predicted ATPase
VTHLIEKTSTFLPDPSISQIKNIVSEYVGLPLGSEAAKEKLEKWNWFLFYGAMGTGKTMTIRALQT